MGKITVVCGAFLIAFLLLIGKAFSLEAPIAEFDSSTASIRVSPGEKFVITLDSNATTGYKWVLADIQEKNILVLSGSKYYPSGDHLVGAGGRERWAFKATGPGMVKLYFRYLRPWEKDSQPAREMVFTIEVIE